MLAYDQQVWMVVALIAIVVVFAAAVALLALAKKRGPRTDLGPSGSDVASSLAARLAERTDKGVPPAAEEAKPQ